MAKQLVRSSCRQGLTSVSCATLCYVEGSKPNGFENFRPELDVGIADPLVNTFYTKCFAISSCAAIWRVHLQRADFAKFLCYSC